MRELPSGTVTLLFTDIESSTRLLQQLGEGYTSLLETCLSLMRSVFLQFLSIGDVRNKFVNY